VHAQQRNAATSTQDPQSLAKNIATQFALPEFKAYELSFEVDPKTNHVVVHVIDAQTHEVVRSIPPDSVAETLRRLSDGARGILLDAEG